MDRPCGSAPDDLPFPGAKGRSEVTSVPHSHASASRYPSAPTDISANWMHSRAARPEDSVAFVTDQSDGNQAGG